MEIDKEYGGIRSFEVHGYFVSRLKAFVAAFLFVSFLIAVVVLAALLAHEKSKGDITGVSDNQARNQESHVKQMTCNVVVVGGGISGLYMAETLMRLKKENNVCLFEKDSRFGGRNYDVRFKQAPNISINLGSWRVDKKNKRVMDLARRLNIPMLSIGKLTDIFFQARGVRAYTFQSLKEKAFSTLMSGPFSNMTWLEMYLFAWRNMTKEKALEFPFYRDFMCERLGSEGCELLYARYVDKRDFYEESTLDKYEFDEAVSYFSYDFYKPRGGISDITTALKISAQRFGAKLVLKEKINALERKADGFDVHTDHFKVSAKKLIIAVPTLPFEAIRGDVAADVKSNVLFGSIQGANAFKAVAIYSSPWWEDYLPKRNRTEPIVETFWSASTCLVLVPYNGRGPQGEAIIQLSYAWLGCAAKWGKMSELPRSIFEAEIKKAVQEVFPDKVVPDPLDMVFKFWDKVAWHETKAGSNVSRHDVKKWAKRPFPGEEIYLVGEAFSLQVGWNEGALSSAYNALKEGWEISDPETN